MSIFTPQHVLLLCSPLSSSTPRPPRYLQEVGYTDTILDVRSQRVRSLLGLAGSEQNGSVETKNLEQILNGGDSPTKRKGQDLKRCCRS